MERSKRNFKQINFFRGKRMPNCQSPGSSCGERDWENLTLRNLGLGGRHTTSAKVESQCYDLWDRTFANCTPWFSTFALQDDHWWLDAPVLCTGKWFVSYFNCGPGCVLKALRFASWVWPGEPWPWRLATWGLPGNALKKFNFTFTSFWDVFLYHIHIHIHESWT
jgi:hypothetical protein